MSEFSFVYHDSGGVRECDCCGYPARLSEFSRPGPAPRKVSLFCEVCSSTYLSQVVWYPTQTDEPNLYRSIGWIANRILDRIGGS